MPLLNDALAALAGRGGPAAAAKSPARTRLAPLPPSSANPGALGAHAYVPPGLQPGAALVVVLHGCTQTAAIYDQGSGWSELAERHGFAVLYPEQVRANNPNLCFNWFQPADASRGMGEAASIRALIAQMIAAHDFDPARVHVTGLSAGGAMAATVMACYPEVFASGAVIAGLPHGAARTMGQAFEAMKGKRLPASEALQDRLAMASPHAGPWPRLSIWHGGADAVVASANAGALLAQWRGVHGADGEPDRLEAFNGATRQRWRDAAGDVVIERWIVPSMGHGTPIAPSQDGLGQAIPFMLDVGVPSTSHIAAFFRIIDDAAALAPETATGDADAARATRRASALQDAAQAAPVDGEAHAPASEARGPSLAQSIGSVLDKALPGQDGVNGSVKQVIETALRRAGLR